MDDVVTQRHTDPERGVLCGECWRRIEGVTVTHLYGLAAYRGACYRAEEGNQYRGKRP